MKSRILSCSFFSFVFLFLISTSLHAGGNYLKINYGISSHDFSITPTSGKIPFDDEDEGFMLSGGTMIGDIWGVDIMYYDLGSSSITLDATEQFKMNSINYFADSAGTISNDISGYGAGLILASNDDTTNPFSVGYYLKAGLHSWDKSGSTTILDNDNSFAGNFYNQGIGGYGGFGIAVNIYNNIAFDIAYDIIGLSNDGSFSNNSSLFSLGFRINF